MKQNVTHAAGFVARQLVKHDIAIVAITVGTRMEASEATR